MTWTAFCVQVNVRQLQCQYVNYHFTDPATLIIIRVSVITVLLYFIEYTTVSNTMEKYPVIYMVILRVISFILKSVLTFSILT